MAELIEFLTDPKVEVRRIAIHHLLPMTGSAEGCALIASLPFVERSVGLLGDVQANAGDALKALLNLTSLEAETSVAFVNAGGIRRLVTAILDPENVHVDLAAMLLSNVTRSAAAVSALLQLSDKDEAHAGELAGFNLNKLVRVFTLESSDPANRYPGYITLDWLGPVFNNVTQTEAGRDIFLANDGLLLRPLLPQLAARSLHRRGGVAGCLKNCSFDEAAHGWMLDESEADVLPQILLRIYVADATYTLKQRVGMPVDILDAVRGSHQRETDPEIRKLLVETLVLYASGASESRDFLLKRKVYPILKAAHEEEDDDEASEAMFQLVELLLCDIVDDDAAEAAGVNLAEHGSSFGPGLGVGAELATAEPAAVFQVGDGSVSDDGSEGVPEVTPLMGGEGGDGAAPAVAPITIPPELDVD